jgi:hypothetical protein
MPRKEFESFTRLDASDVNTYLMDQSVMTFAGTAARGSAITTPAEGMVTYLEDSAAFEYWDSAEWTSLAPAAPSGNAIINGAFEIWQRGTSFAVPSSNNTSYTADRWSAFRAATGSTVSRQVTNDTTNLPNIQYGIRLQRDSGNSATNGITLVQHFETASSIPFAGKVVTVSFYARKGANYSNATSIIDVNLATGTGVDQNIWAGLTGRANPINVSKTVTSTWTRFDVTGTVATTATQIVLNFSIPSFVGTASTNDWVEITGVQLEAGSTANVFRRNANSLQGELAACQRYFFVLTPPTSGYTKIASGFVFSSTIVQACGPISHPVTMRAAPTVTFTFTSNNMTSYDGADSNITAFESGPFVSVDRTTFNVTTSGMTPNRTAHILHRAGNISFASEL